MIGVMALVCLSTVFGYPGDGHGGRTPTLLTGAPVTVWDVGIAHRSWPIGSRVKVENARTGVSVFGVVLDRGPYGKRGADGDWFNSRWPISNRTRPGVYRGCADLTPTLAWLIGHNGGRDKIRLTLVRRGR